MRLENDTSPVVLSAISDPKPTQNIVVQLSMRPREVLDVIEGDEGCMSYCKMTLHVREPGIDPSIVRDYSIHGAVPLLLDLLLLPRPVLSSVRSNALFPLGTDSVEGLLGVNLFHNLLSEALLLLITSADLALVFSIINFTVAVTL